MRGLYILDIDPLDETIPEDMFLALPGERRARLLRYRNGLDRKLGALSDILLRCLICRDLGVGGGRIDIRTAPAGKPFLADFPDYHFSVSHTRCAVAAAVSGEAVGVDIERVRDTDLNLVSSVFSDGELSLLGGAAEDRLSRFYEIWTKKEARLKRLGTGLSGDLRACDVTAEAPGEAFFTVRSGNYILSGCTGTRFNTADLRVLTEGDLAELWRHTAC